MKLWGGRFTKNTDASADSFNSSLRFDSRLYKHDIAGSIAHARMLGKQGIISTEESEKICGALDRILEEITNGTLSFDSDAEDIHTLIETALINKIGDTGRKLHTGRSRNDQVALDLRMYAKEQINEIKSLILELGTALLEIAEAHTATVMPGYTHLQKAQPVTFAHHIMAYFQMFKRDTGRLEDCYDRTDVMPLGSGALAGTTYPLDRSMIAKELGFGSITENSMDAVSDRDFVAELLYCISMIMMHLSRFSEEIVLWSSGEFNFIRLDDAFSTGSSIMPQKKNPDVAELVRGKSGRTFGNLMSLLATMKGLPLAYNKDMQEDKEALFDSVDTVKQCLSVFFGMISSMKINKEKMLSASKGGFTNATDAADYLAVKGLPFRTAHEIIGKLVLYCIDKNMAIEELSLNELRSFSHLFDDDVYNNISAENCVSKRSITGGPAEETVRIAIEKGKSDIRKISNPD
ncbi:MAG: argininosuccinate lyase [Eubacteriales bacterium]|nr:argininosuccinate lyase [Eubacteriales bacterium]